VTRLHFKFCEATHFIFRELIDTVHSTNLLTLRVAPSLCSSKTSCFVHVACGRGSVLLWWRCDTLCTSGFLDDVMFSHNGLCGASCVFISGKNARASTHNQILLNDNETRSATTHLVLHTVLSMIALYYYWI